ncbi:outer membrane beta-barrel protein [Roseivirga sp.]|uniref:outer membrane beta-barrel protein n=1 Tax=Roseivirga sp. TaxID=1964215 RepID=UPI003B8B81B3
MKKSVLLLSLMFFSSLAFGQIQKGDVRLGGSFLYNKTDNDFLETSNFQVNPQASLFLSETTSLGLTVGYGRQKNENGGGIVESDQVNFGVFARFYRSMGEKFYLYLQPGINYSSGDINGGDFSSFGLNVVPGVAYFLSDKFALDANIGGLFYNNQDVGGNDTNNFGLNFNLSGFTLGASIFLRK